MELFFNKTMIGFSHVQNGKVCQDYSEVYRDTNRAILTACDGHGGALYIRSDKGSMFASKAFVAVLKEYTDEYIDEFNQDDVSDKIKLELICKWNELVDTDLRENPFSIEELSELSEEQKFSLQKMLIAAYGTTLNGLMVLNRHIVCVQIGDGGVFFLQNDKAEVAFEDNDENVANITQSLCSDSAFGQLFVSIKPKSFCNGVLLCTDGVLTPYGSYSKFCKYLAIPIVKKLKENTISALEEIAIFVESLGAAKGVGDDVSLCLYITMDDKQENETNITTRRTQNINNIEVEK